MSITVVGTVALDSVETPFGKIVEGLGGSATHFSAAASFFTQVNLVAVVGADFPSTHIDFFKSRGINTGGLQIQQNGKTFRWEGRYDYDLNNAQTIATHLNVIENFRPSLSQSFKDSDVLFLANIDPDLQCHVIEQAGKPGFVVLDSMNLWINTKRESLIKAIGLVDMLTINEAEARLLAGNSNLVRAANTLQSWGPRIVVIKRGEHGALLFYEDAVFYAPALPLEDIIDPTGAGDSFAGGMLGYLDLSHDTGPEFCKTAVMCGSVMASFNVEKFSCDRLKEITMNDIQKRFDELSRLTRFDMPKFES